MGETLQVFHFTVKAIGNNLRTLVEPMSLGLSELKNLKELTIREFRDKIPSEECNKIWANLPKTLRSFGLYAMKNFTHDHILTIVQV